MKIGVIGAGNVGGRLGVQWTRHGHEVAFGVRNPQSTQVGRVLQAAGEGARACTVREAADFGDVVVLAVHWPAVQEVLSQTGDMAGKVLVDCTNRMTSGGNGASAAEDIARMVPRARVVKAFNSLGAEHLMDPTFGGQNASTFICGDDADAKGIVRQLGEDIGFDVVDAGPLSSAGMIESLARLWVTLARQQGGRAIAFRLLRR